MAGTGRDLELLSSYANGPRIWDAASIMPDVHSLHDQGLIEPVAGIDGNRGAYQLTEAGRQALAGQGLTS